MELDEIKNILIIGSGVMGSQIGLLCSIHEYNVTLYDNSQKSQGESKEKLIKYTEELIDSKRISEQQAQEALTRVKYTTNPEEAGFDSDLMSESLPENPKLKCEVFSQFKEICPPHTIFTTNSSTLLPSMLAAATGRVQQFAALHFHPLVWENNLVEIMPHPKTDYGVVSLLKEFAESIEQIPIILEKEYQSYVFNTMLNALNSAALELASNSVASVEDIDRAWMKTTNMKIGPFGVLDKIGLDVISNVTDYWAKVLGKRQLRTNAKFVKRYVDKGRLGCKSGKGFYEYPNPKFEYTNFFSIPKK